MELCDLCSDGFIVVDRGHELQLFSAFLFITFVLVIVPGGFARLKAN